MFRPGENWVYDIFMIVVRFWWGVFKVAGFMIVYVIRERPPTLTPSQTGALEKGTVSTSQVWKIGKPVTSLTIKTHLVLIVALIIIGIVILASPSSAIWIIMLIGSGAFVIVRNEHQTQTASLGNRKVDVLPEQDVANLLAEISEAELPQIDVTVAYTIFLPRHTEWSAETALHFVNQLMVSFPQLLLCISADHETIVWQVLDLISDIEPSILEQLIRTSYPQAEIEVELHTPINVTSPFYRYVSAYRQETMFVAPIAYVNDFKAFDPLNALTQAMNGLQTGERVTYVLALAGIAQEAYKHGQRLITQSTIHPLQFLVRGGVEDAAAKILTKRDRTDKYEYRDQKILEDKLRETLCYVHLWLQVDALDPVRVRHILALVDTQMEHFTRTPFNALSWVDRSLESYTYLIDTEAREQETHVFSQYRRSTTPTFGKHGHPPSCLILESREIAALWHPPSTNFSASRIEWSSGLSDVPEAVVRLEDGIVMGVGKYQGREVTVRIPHADRVTHVNVVGKTGAGKSTLLHTLIHQDIARGAGVAVIDPHGQLVRDVLRSSIPPSREADVVVLDIANDAFPPPLNPLRGVQGYASTLKMVGVVERLFAGTEGAARMASYLRAALIPLGNEPQATMRDVTRMFMDDVYREQRLTATDDPETLDFWDYQYNNTSSALQRQIAEPIINRIRPFYANPYLYPILCHSDSLDLHSFMQQGKIILISLALDEERVPEQERNLIGALLMSQLQMASMKAQLRQPFYLYVDEVQRFVTTSLSEMLSEARKYNLSLTIANQFLGQLTGKTLDAVMGNVGTSVIFRCSPDDARDLAAYTKPQFDAQALMDLDRFQAVVKLQADGKTQPAFNVLSLMPIEVTDDALEREQRIRQQSIVRYTPRSRDDVLEWLKARYPRRRATTAADPGSAEEVTFYE